MATLSELTQQVNTLTTKVNAIINNSKTISELSLKGSAELSDEIAINNSLKLTIEKILTLILTEVEDLINEKESILRNIQQKSSNYTITNTDYTIECISGTFTVTLPTAVGIQGKLFNIVNNGDGLITLDGNGSETIMGSLNQTINIGDSITVQSNNTNWIII